VLVHDDIKEDPEWVYRTVLTHVGADPTFVPPDLDEVRFSNQGPDKAKVTAADREKLWPLFAEDVDRLEQLVGRDLAAWRPEGVEAVRPPYVELAREYSRILSWIQELMENTRTEQWDQPTPCAEWTVHDLLVHMAEIVGFSVLFHNPRDGAELTRPLIETREPDPVGTYAIVRSLLEDALDQPDPWKMATQMYGAMRPASAHIALLMVNQLAHGWDLAIATGQDASIPRDLAELAEPCARELVENTPILRTVLGEEIPTADDAPASTRFLAFLGRDVASTPAADGPDPVG
jgi:uncharacterized protein (TIGR03086 family)